MSSISNTNSLQLHSTANGNAGAAAVKYIMYKATTLNSTAGARNSKRYEQRRQQQREPTADVRHVSARMWHPRHESEPPSLSDHGLPNMQQTYNRTYNKL